MTTIDSTETLHPEIAAPAWATDRHLEDDGHAMVDQHEYEDNNISVTLSVTHSFTSHGVRAHKEHAFISWANLWPGEGVDTEEMTVFIEDLPEVAAVLLRAYDKATAMTATVQTCFHCEARSDRPEDNQHCVYDGHPHAWHRATLCEREDCDQ